MRFLTADYLYPLYINPIKEGVLQISDKGIVVCGTGIGISIAANKIKGIRAALCFTKEHAKMSTL